MATAKPYRTIGRRRFTVRRVALWLALAAMAVLAVFWRPLSADAVTATAYGARIGCACRFVAQRSLSNCRDDFEPGMTLVILSEDAEGKSVTAWIPLLSSQTATYRDGQGCALEAWES